MRVISYRLVIIEGLKNCNFSGKLDGAFEEEDYVINFDSRTKVNPMAYKEIKIFWEEVQPRRMRSSHSIHQ